MYIDTAKSTRGDKTYTRYLLRDSHREDGKVKHRTIANLGACSEEEIAAMKLALKHKGNLQLLGNPSQVKLTQGKKFGATWFLKQIADRLGLTKALGQDYQGALALWQVFARIIDQGSRLSAMRLSSSHAVGEVLGIDGIKKDQMYENLTWIFENQESIEKKLWETHCKKNQQPPELFLYDVTSSYLEGQKNELANYGYNRDGKKGKKQIVIGLLTSSDGTPIAVRVFEGNTVDTKTVAEQVRILAHSFGVEEVTLVGDRGMLKTPQIDALPEGFRYITAITKPMIRTLLEKDIIQETLFDEALHEVVHEGVRYIVRCNPIRVKEIQDSRTNKFFSVSKQVVELNSYLTEHPKARVASAKKKIETKINKLNIQPWVDIEIDEKSRIISCNKNEEKLKEESFLDGVYVIKTDLSKDKASTKIVHDRYKDLKHVESAFRTMKTAHLQVRPIFVRKDPRTRGHVFVVMLAYLMVRELEKYWKTVDMTVEEGIDELASLPIIEVATSQGTCLTIPMPSPRVASLLELSDLIMPGVLPKVRRIVHTNKTHG
jgi:transposase